jgi:N-acetylglucosamine kinase-like BadF-type ATPase
MKRFVLGIDGGNSKVDVALVDESGDLVSAARGPTVSHQAVGLDAGMARLRGLVATAAASANIELQVDLAVASLAGADYPEDVEKLRAGIEGIGLAKRVIVVNDTIGAFRAGASGTWGVALVCGKGINAAAIAPGGAQARFPGVGDIAGDWGGGGGVGMAALQAAVRGRDGRGPRTSLESAVPAHFALADSDTLVRELYFERIPEIRIAELSPVAFAEAAAGDSVARSIISRLAAELAGMANALIRQLDMASLPVEVILAGGVFKSTDTQFYEELYAGIHAVAPAASFVHLAWPPVAGAVLMGLDEFARQQGFRAVDAGVAEKARTALGTWNVPADLT